MDIEVRVEGIARTVTPYIFPATNRFSLPPTSDSPPMQVLVFRVPSDDTSFENYLLGYSESNEPVSSELQAVRAIRTELGLGDYKALPEDWWGVDLTDQDRMAVEQQGVITDRTSEHLVASDVGIVRMRRMMREALEAVQRGDDPIGIIRDPAKQNVELGFLEEFGVQQTDYSAVLFEGQPGASN